MKLNIRDINLSGKKVLMRVDFNVPMKNGEITDTNRIVQALPTINYALEQGAKVILFSHLGRVKEEKDLAKNDIAPVAKKLQEMISAKVTFVNATRGAELENAINEMQCGEIVMFQNTRYEDLVGKKESKNDPELGAYWASLGDVFVNDAFGTAHRDAASNTGIAKYVKGESVSGFLLEKEINFIGGAVDNPVHPFVAILGGAKVSDKISVIENLLTKADKIMICGAMAYTFFKALGYEVGDTVYIYKNGKLVSKTHISSKVITPPIIKDGGKYEIVVESEAGVKSVVEFKKDYIANQAGSVLMIVLILAVVICLFAGLLFRNKLKVDN